MAGKTFAQINCSLLRSKRLRDCTHAERWAYICAHLTPLGNFTGLFTYPAVMWAKDAAVPPDGIAKSAARLSDLGLIEYDEDEELLRLIGYHRQRPPENASRVVSLVGDFYGTLPGTGLPSQMRLNTIAEFAVAAVYRAAGWKPDSTDRPKVRDALKPLLLQEWQEHGEAFQDALRAELDCATQAARNEIQSLFPVEVDRPLDTMPTPCSHRARTRDVDETRPIQHEEKDEYENKTAQNSRCEHEQAFGPVEKSELLRNDAGGNRPAPMPGPLAATKRSALARGV